MSAPATSEDRTATAVPDLTPLLRPESIAVLGGTSKPTGLGSRTLAHLRAAEYPGTVVVPPAASRWTGTSTSQSSRSPPRPRCTTCSTRSTVGPSSR